ncbi:hypothetical protein JGH11_13475 [Dysgonomonas sp. Marseille-P4677]|uniref:hypothetical protein n=1 Tax=Dysgonomonas sp. Marseille-P4677 TaxID=2364790 RepID=UPI001914B9C8|nr:hypothetical protein [Dysgonomonas sp. Marseille-P4677]MBK5721884.1 hypothetical protein [Dysgonomonas sp. Marseille-P4677]
MKTAKKLILFFSLFVSAGFSVLFTAAFINRLNLPYNSEGRYSEGIIVYHEQAVEVFGIISFVFIIITILLAYLLYKSLRKNN